MQVPRDPRPRLTSVFAAQAYLRFLPPCDHEPGLPSRRASCCRRVDRLDVHPAARDQPRDHRVRVPHVARLEVIAARHGRRHLGDAWGRRLSSWPIGRWPPSRRRRGNEAHSWGRANCTLRARRDAAQHSPAHDEADQLDRLDEQPCPPMRVAVALPHDQPGAAIRLVAQDEGPREVIRGRPSPDGDTATQDQRAPRLQDSDDQADLISYASWSLPA
jgi:hypothetical protein